MAEVALNSLIYDSTVSSIGFYATSGHEVRMSVYYCVPTGCFTTMTFSDNIMHGN